MSAYTTRTITQAKAKELLRDHYAKRLASVETMGFAELESELDLHISDDEDYLLINFSVISNERYMQADIS